MDAFAGLGYESIESELELSEPLLSETSDPKSNQTMEITTSDSLFRDSEVSLLAN